MVLWRMSMDTLMHTWLNVAMVLVIAGAAVYLTLIPYMTSGDE